MNNWEQSQEFLRLLAEMRKLLQLRVTDNDSIKALEQLAFHVFASRPANLLDVDSMTVTEGHKHPLTGPLARWADETIRTNYYTIQLSDTGVRQTAKRVRRSADRGPNARKVGTLSLKQLAARKVVLAVHKK